MITLTYGLAGACLAVTALLFQQDVLTATTQTIAWCVIFFFASAGASAAYLTVSEIFPMEMRAMAIAFFYAVGTGIGGITGPLLFGILVGTEDVNNTMIGFQIGAGWLLLDGADRGYSRRLGGTDVARRESQSLCRRCV